MRIRLSGLPPYEADRVLLVENHCWNAFCGLPTYHVGPHWMAPDLLSALQFFRVFREGKLL